MNTFDNRSDRRGGFYWHTDGKPYISVTTVLSVIAKPQLQYWFGKEVYRAMVVDPSLSEKEALNAPYATSKKAMGRGTTIHSIVEAYKHTKEYIEDIPDDFKDYAKAFYAWVSDNDVEFVEHEKTMVSKKYGYAGTMDLLVKFKKSGRIFIIDVKTGKDIYDEAYLQLSAYRQALKETENVDAEVGVLLLATGKDDKSTGTYKFEQGTDLFEEFLAAKKLWVWKNSDLIESLKKHIRSLKKIKEGGDNTQNESNN